MRSQKWLGLVTVLAAGFAAQSSYGAVTVLINSSTHNGSFEAPGEPLGTLTMSNSTGNWFESNGSGSGSISNAITPGATDGTQFATLSVYFGSEYITNQPISFTGIPYGSTNVLLSFDAIQIIAGDTPTWSYNIGVRLNPGLPDAIQNPTNFSPTSTWSHFSYYIPYNPIAGESQFNYINLSFTGAADNHTGSSELGIDNVVLELVPEPATLGVLGMGAMGLFLKRRR